MERVVLIYLSFSEYYGNSNTRPFTSLIWLDPSRHMTREQRKKRILPQKEGWGNKQHKYD